MQAQALRTEPTQDILTSQQSLQSIQTLLRAGLGCITYLRNLLPADNFSESYLTSANSDSLSSHPSECSGSFSSENGRRNVSGFKIMTVTRGYTEEADKLLDFLENGIFDALQKKYLRSFIFAIYLDSEDPNNIVEAYTFNFHYHTIPGTNTVVPVMSLGEDLMRLSISGSKKSADPVADASKKGRIPTLGEVKRSLKTLIKNLIQATTQMDALPKRRYATFKLFYHDHTPDDYEPPHFRAGDLERDKWYFTTHDRGEVPEKCSIGTVQTGWHGVDVKVTSVSGYLPSLEDNNAPFLGTTNSLGPHALALTPVEEAAVRAQQTEIQRQDAIERRVVWDAEDGQGDADADGEDDEGGGAGDISQILGTWRMSPSGVEFVAPIGVRDEEGNILPWIESQTDAVKCPGLTTIGDAHYVGAQEKVPSHVGQLDKSTPQPASLEQTQQITMTQLLGGPQPSPLSSPSPSPAPSPSRPPTPKAPVLKHRMSTRSRSTAVVPESLPCSDIMSASIPSVSSFNPGQETIDTQELQDVLIARGMATQEDSEMLDMETQVIPSIPVTETDTIQSFSSTHIENQGREVVISASVTDTPMEEQDDADAVLDCECGVTLDDSDCMLCDGGCKRWFHVWCMGFHNAADTKMLDKFICFDCRVRADQNWDLIMVHDLYPRMIERFRDLALFRRAIKIYETSNPQGLSPFAKLIGCEPIVAGQLFKRLETEGFITLETKENDELGLIETRTRSSRGRGRGGAKTKQSTRRKSMQKSRYIFVQSSKNTKTYSDYFSPDPEVEKRTLGLSDLKPKRRLTSKRIVYDQDEDMESQEAPPTITDITASITQDTIIPNISQQGSQTQDETQASMPQFSRTRSDTVDIPKRKTTEQTEEPRMTKKVKISVGPAVDLGD